MPLSSKFREAMEVARARVYGRKPRRRVFIAENRNPMSRHERRLFIAPSEEDVRQYAARTAFLGEVPPEDIDVGVYYGPFMPETENLLRYPRIPRSRSQAESMPSNMREYVKQGPFGEDDSYAFDERDYWLLQDMRERARGNDFDNYYDTLMKKYREW